MIYAFIGSGLILCLVSFTIYMGAFRSIAIEERTMGPYYFVYSEMEGSDFSQVGKITTELASYLQKQNVQGAKPLDIFYPNVTEQTKNEIGFAITEEDFLHYSFDESVKTRKIEARPCMVTEFPWRNPMSFFVGFLRVDPALQKYRDANGYVKTEALSINDGDKIIYIQPIRTMN